MYLCLTGLNPARFNYRTFSRIRPDADDPLTAPTDDVLPRCSLKAADTSGSWSSNWLKASMALPNTSELLIDLELLGRSGPG